MFAKTTFKISLVFFMSLILVGAGFAQEMNPELFKTGSSHYRKQMQESQYLSQQDEHPQVQLLRQKQQIKASQPPAQAPARRERSQRIDLFQNAGQKTPQVHSKGTGIFYGSGMMHKQNSDKVYFNFANQTNGADTTGMDVMISSNEGTNFGSEAASTWQPGFDDPSLLYYLSDNASLDTINTVPSINDSTHRWITISWDWPGMPLQAGMVWVIYTRTTNCYAVMEITSSTEMNWDSTAFAFDYKYQPDGSTNFDGSGPEPDSLNFLVNGVGSDTVTVGDNPSFTFDFPANTDIAEFGIYWDKDGDGVLSSADILLDYMDLYDNDANDNDPTDGKYEFVLGDDSEGINHISESFIYEVYTPDVTEHTHLLWLDLTSDYSASGFAMNDIGTPLEGIIVLAFSFDTTGDEPKNMWVDITDSDGGYHIYLPDSGQYEILSQDFLGVTAGLYPQPDHYSEYIDGHLGGYDFVYTEPTASITGTVMDEYGMAVTGVEVYVENFMYQSDTTDAHGYFDIPVMPGEYWVGLNPSTVIPDYMMPENDHRYVMVEENGSAYEEFFLYQTDAKISGIVYLDDVPQPGIRVNGWHDGYYTKFSYGWTEDFTNENGYYELHVKSDQDTTAGGYNIHVFDLEPGVIQENPLFGISAGEKNVDIYLTTVSGGLYGAFINTETGDTLYDQVWLEARNLDNGSSYWINPDWETGEYTRYLVDGTYEIFAGGEGFHHFIDTVNIAGSLIHYDVLLDPISFDGAIYGQVSDCDQNMPLMGAEVFIHKGPFSDGENFAQVVYTDSSGSYWVDVPNGSYIINVEMEGFNPIWDSAFVDYNEVERNFCMTPFTGEGIFEGTVFGDIAGGDTLDSEPLPMAGVHVFNNMEERFLLTDGNGHFYFELPDGGYQVEVSKPGYAMVHDSIHIFNDHIVRDYYLDKLPTDGMIMGVVYEGSPDYPIPGATVMLANVTDSTGYRQFTDENGNFAIGVANGLYHLRVKAPEYVAFDEDSILVEYDTTYFEVNMTPFDGSLSGVVYDQMTNEPVPEAGIGARNLDTDQWFYTRADHEGFYFLGLINGTYEVIAGAPNYELAMDTVSIDNNDIILDFYLKYNPEHFMPPDLFGVKDVPLDQGRRVRLIWYSGHINFGYIQEFSIWRHVHGELWDYVETVPFIHEGDYADVVPTLVDSNKYTGPGNNFWSTFVVVGHTNLPEVFMPSEPMAGYSIDNLVPTPPQNVNAVPGESGVTLAWQPVPASDFDYYAIHRSTQSGVPTNDPYAYTTDTLFVDEAVETGNTYYYAVTAVDFNGNVSPASSEVSTAITAIDESQQVPEEYSLFQNFPNPFNPTTTISFGLPEAAQVELTIYNLRGQFIRRLTRATYTPGYHRLTWDACDRNGNVVGSGVYIYVLKAGDFHQSRKMILLR